ncbi:MAG: hypothetical protein ACK5V3_00480 [Bdellovibrionales bacterium]
MFGKSCLFFLSLSFVIGCARPKYINESDPATSGETTEESKIECKTRFLKNEMCLIWYWEKRPTSQTMGSLIFKIFKLNLLDQTPIEMDPPNTPELILWMPSMGHGSTPTQVQRIDTGTYRAGKVYFIMPGEWELKFQIKNGSELIDEAKINILF